MQIRFNKTMTHTYEQIESAIKTQKGGIYRLLLQRVIDGHKCKAFTRITTIDGIEYWSIEYVITGSADTNHLVTKMFDIINEKVKALNKKCNIVLWRY